MMQHQSVHLITPADSACLCCVQVGIDDVLHSWFREQQVQQAHRAAASCSAATCRAAARTGLPASERPWVWATALGIHAAPPDFSYSSNPAPPADAKQQPSTRKGAAAGVAAPGSSSPASQQPATGAVVAAGRAASNRFPDWWRLPSQRDHQVLQLLCESVEQQVLLTDVLTCADVQRLADNEHYFVFEEEMRCAVSFTGCGTGRTNPAERTQAVLQTDVMLSHNLLQHFVLAERLSAYEARTACKCCSSSPVATVVLRYASISCLQGNSPSSQP